MEMVCFICPTLYFHNMKPYTLFELLQETLDFERWCTVQLWYIGNKNSDQNIAGFKFLHNYSFEWGIYNTKTWRSNFLSPSLFWDVIQCWLITTNQRYIVASHPRRVNISFTPGWSLNHVNNFCVYINVISGFTLQSRGF
jgi:hypothetical protein